MERFEKAKKVLEILEAHRALGEVSDGWLAERILDAIEDGWMSNCYSEPEEK